MNRPPEEEKKKENKMFTSSANPKPRSERDAGFEEGGSSTRKEKEGRKKKEGATVIRQREKGKRAALYNSVDATTHDYIGGGKGKKRRGGAQLQLTNQFTRKSREGHSLWLTGNIRQDLVYRD